MDLQCIQTPSLQALRHGAGNSNQAKHTNRSVQAMHYLYSCV